MRLILYYTLPDSNQRKANVIKSTRLKRSRKYFAPQNEGVKHKCNHPDCNKEGEFKAPKDRSLKDYYWFCLEHVQEYNAKWNYYTDEASEQDQEKTYSRARAHFNSFHSRIKYKFGSDLDEELSFLHGFSNYDKITDNVYFTKKDRKELEHLEMTEEDFSVENLKKQYKKLAKTCHPDLHPEDKEAEEKFKRLTEAYKKLLEKMS